jgi:hypothetical protein
LQVQALLAKLEAGSTASATAAAAEAQARSRADSRAAAKLKEVQVTKHVREVLGSRRAGYQPSQCMQDVKWTCAILQDMLVYNQKYIIWVLLQAAAEKKAAALQVEREARRAAEARATEAEAARQADGRLRRAAEKNASGFGATTCTVAGSPTCSGMALTCQRQQVPLAAAAERYVHLLGRHCNACRIAQAKDLEAKLDAQTKRTQEAVAKAEAARSAVKASAMAIATLEAQLAGLQVKLRRLTLQAAAHEWKQGAPCQIHRHWMLLA